jgi:hypothetical protein
MLCDETVNLVDQLTADGVVCHRACFRYNHCRDAQGPVACGFWVCFLHLYGIPSGRICQSVVSRSTFLGQCLQGLHWFLNVLNCVGMSRAVVACAQVSCSGAP